MPEPFETIKIGGINKYPAGIPDGTSNTIFWTEDLANCVGYPAYTVLTSNNWALAEYNAVAVDVGVHSPQCTY